MLRQLHAQSRDDIARPGVTLRRGSDETRTIKTYADKLAPDSESGQPNHASRRFGALPPDLGLFVGKAVVFLLHQLVLCIWSRKYMINDTV